MKEDHKGIWASFILLAILVGAILHPGIFFNPERKNYNETQSNSTMDNKSVHLQIGYFIVDLNELKGKTILCGDLKNELECPIEMQYTDGNTTYSRSIPVHINVVIK